MSWPVLLLLLLVVPLAVGLWRVNELFVLRVRGGRVRRQRGKIPPALLRDLQDVVRTAGFRQGQIRAVVEGGHAAIRVTGPEVPRGLEQRLRNTISLWPLAKIRNAPGR